MHMGVKILIYASPKFIIKEVFIVNSMIFLHSYWWKRLFFFHSDKIIMIIITHQIAVIWSDLKVLTFYIRTWTCIYFIDFTQKVFYAIIFYLYKSNFSLMILATSLRINWQTQKWNFQLENNKNKIVIEQTLNYIILSRII